MKKNYIAAQLGARMHYAVPQILHSNNMLEHFYTDISIDVGWPKVFKKIPDSFLPNEIKRLKARRLPMSIIRKTKTFPLTGVEYALRRINSKKDIYSNHLWAGDEFNKKILRKGFGNANAIFTYNSAGLILMQTAREHNIFCTMEQTIAPKVIELSLIEEMKSKFPHWDIDHVRGKNNQLMIDREFNEWELADKIICGSDFVKKGIGLAGGDVDKCIVVPYGVPAYFNRKELSYKGERKLRVLVAGEIGIRKGSPFVLNVAKRLKNKIKIRMVGTVAVPDKCRYELEKYVEILGIVPRSEMVKHFHWADVFFLPSVCEGSATVTYEAISAGLPVVCTENTGSIVQNNFDGFVVANMDEDAMVNSLEKLADDVSLYKRLAENTEKSAFNAGLEAYSKRFIEAVS